MFLVLAKSPLILLRIVMQVHKVKQVVMNQLQWMVVVVMPRRGNPGEIVYLRDGKRKAWHGWKGAMEKKSKYDNIIIKVAVSSYSVGINWFFGGFVTVDGFFW